ncbi:pyridoxal phosphate-dependent aminotransferase [Heyndrickxia coagulans]|uniref:pyridoxal phosphate-dependent aminotransferase n=1 Tax=Bacillaceae TaxID=186817 RepID=UPI00182755DF|nr:MULTISPECIES: pyridoxal phosphate-dependent aminotransferase [Bacillaceae]MCB7071183.1 pyridoxal phosphate-dependent aminotransferase [Caldibacillus sp. 210928-DFI.2.22]MCB7074658.1 pyridoxal phosphate-dependent aminotransferase [Caldibacillus sp. 210928-DFI.2.18]NWN97083.1 pyridoxal phosphate-dependent aminotransferase [Bacillus sp. (in: firmicutes)]UJZ87098.1 pyridoxal phosphate-dependent aminotransferase [Heyndrickxia coagulans]
MDYSEKLKSLPTQFFANLVGKVNKAIEDGRDVINLGQGNPDQPTPKHIVQALQKAVEDPNTHKYSPFRGLLELKEAVCDFYKKEYDVDVDPVREVAILFGAKAGLVELPMCLLNPGDLMLLPDPGYPDYLSGVVLAGVEYELFPLKDENHFLPDYNAISSDVLDAAKLLYLNYPNNPTGAVANLDFFNQTVKLAKKHEITVMHDFAYGAIGFDGKKPVSFLQADGAKDIGVEMYTLSKTYNMAGWRVGFAVGNPTIIEAINLIQDHLYVSLFPAVQKAAIAALSGDQTCVKELVARYESRRNAFVDACKQIGWDVTAPKGSFFAWLPVPDGFTSQSFADYLLDAADVAVAPGNGFGKYGEGFIRVGLLMDEARLVEAVQRIGNLGVFKNK